MAKCMIQGATVRGVMSAIPSQQFDNLKDAAGFTEGEIRKVVGHTLVVDGGLNPVGE